MNGSNVQVVSVINKINERRNAQMTTPRNSCESPAQNGVTCPPFDLGSKFLISCSKVQEEKFYTPRELFFRNMSGCSNQSSVSPESANGKKLMEDNFVTPLAAPDAWDIRKVPVRFNNFATTFFLIAS